jgi:hypothetical protein
MVTILGSRILGHDFCAAPESVGVLVVSSAAGKGAIAGLSVASGAL